MSNAPAIGKDVVFTFDGGPVATEISAATLDLQIQIHGITLIHVSYDFCADMGIKCPVLANHGWVGSATWNVPKGYLPSGIKFTNVATFVDASGSQLDCYQFTTGLSSNLLAVPEHTNATLV